ncbi:hypothetical protein [Cupriavidus necator]
MKLYDLTENAQRIAASRLATRLRIPTTRYVNGRRKPRTLNDIRASILETCAGPQGTVRSCSAAELDAWLGALVSVYCGDAGPALQLAQSYQRTAAWALCRARDLMTNELPRLKRNGIAFRRNVARIDELHEEAEHCLALGRALHDAYGSDKATANADAARELLRLRMEQAATVREQDRTNRDAANALLAGAGIRYA